MCVLTILSCRSRDNMPIDPRQEFVGSYRISITEATLYEGEITESPFTTDVNSRIKFELNSTLNKNELIVNMEAYIKNLYTAYFMSLGAEDVSVNITINEDIIAQISENNFKINNTEFRVTVINLVGEVPYIIENKINAVGEMNKNSLQFNFNIEWSNNFGKGVLEGVSKGKKD